MASVLRHTAPPPANLPVALARVLAELLDGAAPVPSRCVPLDEAAGAMLAAPLVVPAPVPARAVALRRGYAVASADTLGASPYSPLPLPAVPALVEAGDTLPAGCDAVLPKDTVLITGALAEAQDSASPGLWARRIGEDAPAGAVLRGAGETVRALDVAIAGNAGVTSCEIRRPRLLILPGGPATAAAVRLVAALAGAAGTEVRTHDAPDLAEADLVLAFDRRALEQQDARVVAPRLALRPGEDGAVLRLGETPALLMPDRLADALGVWLALGLPLVRALAGAAQAKTEERRLTRKISSVVGVAELALLRIDGGSAEPLGVGDLALAAIAGADAWMIVPPESEGFPTGTAVAAERMAP